MRLGKYLSSLTKPELDNLRVQLNLTDDEDLVFLQLSKGKSKVAVAENCGISTPTVDNRIKAINKKIVRLEMVQCE
jgi:DNA-binding NarL/FixJ family response regulator